MYNRNNNDPNTEPGGTPHFAFRVSEILLQFVN